MAATNRFVGAAQVFFQGGILATAKKVSISEDSNDNDVDTMKDGYAGNAKGSFKSMIDVDQAILIDDQDMPKIRALVQSGKAIRLGVIFGKQRLSYDGTVRSCKMEAGTDGPSSFSFSVRAGKPRET